MGDRRFLDKRTKKHHSLELHVFSSSKMIKILDQIMVFN